MFRALSRTRPHIPASRHEKLRSLMNASIRDCSVTGYEPLIAGIDLPDPDDRHVVAAALRCRADLIVTFNLGDFPDDKLTDLAVSAISPDDFLLDLIGLDIKVVWACIQQIVDSRTSPPASIDDVLGQLERSGIIEATAMLRVS